MKRRRPETPVTAGSQVGFAWFTREQWQGLTEVVDDRNEPDAPFEQWERNALTALYKLEFQGHSVRKVMVDRNTRGLVPWARPPHRRHCPG